MMKIVTLVALGFAFLTISIVRGDDAAVTRKQELEPLLRALQWKPAPPKDPNNDRSENPGWYNPRNRQAVAAFVAKYPDTEEAFLAEVWLIFAKADTDKIPDIKETMRRRAADAEALLRIINKTNDRGLIKIAKILRACELAAAGDHVGLRKQANEILAHIKEYESETDSEYLRFIEVEGTPLMETEPYLRRSLIISECHQKNLGEALRLAEELQAKFPDWSKRNLIHSDIYQLKHGRSPYPTWEELKDIGRVR